MPPGHRQSVKTMQACVYPQLLWVDAAPGERASVHGYGNIKPGDVAPGNKPLTSVVNWDLLFLGKT